ncbi:MAG: glycosyltransferase [Thermomicrobiales bacterium]|nr:glycosyltransferase [Thermomicrobiales bacterium]
MAFDLVRVCAFGRDDPDWVAAVRLAGAREHEADGFDIRAFPDDTDLSARLIAHRPQAIVSFGAPADFPNLMAAPLETRRRWVNFTDPAVTPGTVAERILATFLLNVTEARFPEQPLLSVFTPTYLTGDAIQRPLRSLLAQSYPNWEWVLYDDSPDEGRTFAQLQELERTDQRIGAFRGGRPCGAIGEVKRRACGLAKGAMLVELDHDDALTPHALRAVVEAHRAFPAAGFFYSDWAEVFEGGGNATYPDGWGFGFGGYRTESLGGHDYQVAVAPDINSKTIRHIVSAPNHLRAWTRAAYQASGGHHPDMHVCDDYELVVRTFLTTRMVHIRRFGYVQHYNQTTIGNAQRRRNAEIQRLTRHLASAYTPRIHRRFAELGVDDFIWRPGDRLDWDTPNPPDAPYANERYDGSPPSDVRPRSSATTTRLVTPGC